MSPHHRILPLLLLRTLHLLRIHLPNIQHLKHHTPLHSHSRLGPRTLRTRHPQNKSLFKLASQKLGRKKKEGNSSKSRSLQRIYTCLDVSAP